MIGKKLLMGNLLLLATAVHATVVVNLPAAATAKAYDHFNDVFYLGLSGGGKNAISFLNRYSGVGTPLLNAFNPDTTNITGVKYMTLVTTEGDAFPDLAVVPSNNLKRSHVITFNDTILLLPSNLLDASSVTPGFCSTSTVLNGAPTAGVVALAASNDYIFDAVSPTGSSIQFGRPNSGIAVVGFSPTFTAIMQIAAQPGDGGIKAARLDQSTPNITIGTMPPGIGTQPSLFWDSRLQRLYTGLILNTAPSANNGAISVVVGLIDANIKLVFNYFAAPGLFLPTNDTNMVGVVSSGTTKNTGIYNMRTMHTSTGADYLIINGGVNNPSSNPAPTNTLYALPLINLEDPTNPIQGTLASIDGFDPSTGHFTMQPTDNAHLPADDQEAVVIGQGPLPIEDQFSQIADMDVVGDVVYVSFDNQQDPEDETGIFYSQALFDQTGKVASWTPWAKRAFPYSGFPAQTSPNVGETQLFGVDADNGKIWAVEGSAMLSIATTSWDYGADAGSPQPQTLPGVLNKFLTDGCYSVLDLDNATLDFSFVPPPPNRPRYTLFGGLNKVAFALTGVKQYPVPTCVTTNYNNPQTFLVTFLPSNSGCVTSLAYSQQLGNDPTNPLPINYFFAGTQQGLYVFAGSAGNGFTTTDLGNLNQAPFTNQWIKAPYIQGSIITLRASGNQPEEAASTSGSLYVVARQTDPIKGFVCRIYRIPYTSNVYTMFAPTNIYLLAESGTSAPNADLSSTSVFFGIENVSDGINEQLLLATDQGLFGSSALEDDTANFGTLTAINQQQAAWQQITAQNTLPYTGIFGPITPIKSTTWPIRIADQHNCATFGASVLNQVNYLPTGDSTTNPVIFTYSPRNFNAYEPTPALSAFDTTNYFWSDGGRRFLIVKRPGDCGLTKLEVIPFNNLDWGITTPKSQVLVDPVLTTVQNFYWVAHIGVTGILMAGTDSGVVALE